MGLKEMIALDIAETAAVKLGNAIERKRTVTIDDENKKQEMEEKRQELLLKKKELEEKRNQLKNSQ